MTEYPKRQKLSDDDVRAILLAPAEEGHADLARRYGVHSNCIRQLRKRRSYRALRLARELGLLSPATTRTVWDERTDRAVEVSIVQARRV